MSAALDRGPALVQDAGAVPVAATVAGEAVALACGDGTLRVFQLGEPAPAVIHAHRGAVLSLAAEPGGRSVLTGGDDGRFLRVGLYGTVEELASFGRGWVDHVATARTGARACSVGRVVHLWDADGHRRHELDHPSTVGGLAFDPKGGRLAAAHYGGAAVWTEARRGWKSTQLKWAGSHLGASWSPDGRFLVTTMQENALHGWRVRDKADMRMSGYPARVKGWAWVGATPWLATTGADDTVLWPFDGPHGPMGRAPTMLGHLHGGSQVTAVLDVPGWETALTGFADGGVTLAHIDRLSEPEQILRPTGSAVLALALTSGWLLAAREDGSIAWGPLETTLP